METTGVEEKILEAAKDVFTRRGFAAASMREIADKAGVNKGLLHYYKWNKRKLFMSVFEEAFSKFALKINEIMDSERSIQDKVRAFVGHYMDMLLENPHLPAFVISELNQHPEEFMAGILRHSEKPDPSKLLVQIQLEGEAGRIRQVNPFHFFLHLLSMCVFPFLARPMLQGIMHLDQPTYLQLMQKRKEEIIDFALHGLEVK